MLLGNLKLLKLFKDVETINLDDFKYNRANLTALRIIKSDSAFYKTIALNLTDYYSNNLINNNDKNKILLNVCLTNHSFTIQKAAI